MQMRVYRFRDSEDGWEEEECLGKLPERPLFSRTPSPTPSEERLGAQLLAEQYAGWE